jgi:hypothetical protein
VNIKGDSEDKNSDNHSGQSNNDEEQDWESQHGNHGEEWGTVLDLATEALSTQQESMQSHQPGNNEEHDVNNTDNEHDREGTTVVELASKMGVAELQRQQTKSSKFGVQVTQYNNDSATHAGQ